VNGVLTKKPAASIRKRAHEQAIRINISLPPMLYDEGHRLAKQFGFSGLSAYIQDKIRRDVETEKKAA
jgi:metal-responsive CopG/Arc/MetJ family transcriptional regulator